MIEVWGGVDRIACVGCQLLGLGELGENRVGGALALDSQHSFCHHPSLVTLT